MPRRTIKSLKEELEELRTLLDNEHKMRIEAEKELDNMLEKVERIKEHNKLLEQTVVFLAANLRNEVHRD